MRSTNLPQSYFPHHNVFEEASRTHWLIPLMSSLLSFPYFPGEIPRYPLVTALRKTLSSEKKLESSRFSPTRLSSNVATKTPEVKQFRNKENRTSARGPVFSSRCSQSEAVASLDSEIDGHEGGGKEAARHAARLNRPDSFSLSLCLRRTAARPRHSALGTRYSGM